MIQKNGSHWVRRRKAIDLLDRPVPLVGQSGSVCRLQCNWYKSSGNNKTLFTYDATDGQWIDIEMVISNVNLSMKSGIQDRVYILDASDLQALTTYIQNVSRM